MRMSAIFRVVTRPAEGKIVGGWVGGRALAPLADAAPSCPRVDARRGFAQPALALSLPVELRAITLTDGSFSSRVGDGTHPGAEIPRK